MKRILVSLGTVVFLGALVASGTGAFFSDEETSTGNTFTAGALDLKVDSVAHYNGMICFDSAYSDGYEWHPGDIVDWTEPSGPYALVPAVDSQEDYDAAVAAFNLANPAFNPEAGDPCGGTWDLTDLGGVGTTFFSFSDLKPGDMGENTVSLHVLNNDAYVCAAIHDVEDNDNTLTEPEGEDGDVTPGPIGGGELGGILNFRIWEDDGDNILEVGEETLTTGPASNIEGGVVYPLFTPANGGALTGASTTYLGVQWCYGTFVGNTCDGELVDNQTQTDSFEGDITFYAEQARNNGDFTCPDIDEFEGDDEEPVGPTVGARVAGASFNYVEPTSCDVTIDDGQAVEGGVNAIALAVASSTVADGSTICVDAGSYNQFEVNRPLTVVGLNDPDGPNAAVVNPSGEVGTAIVNVKSGNTTIKGLKVMGDPDMLWFKLTGIQVITSGSNISNVNILDNIVTDIDDANASGSNRGAYGIKLFASDDAGGANDILNTTVSGNWVKNITSAAGGAYGIQVVNDVSGVSITNNTVDSVDGSWEAGVSVDASSSRGQAASSGVTITLNDLLSLTGIPGVQVEGLADAGDVEVHQNNLDVLLFGTSLSSTGTLDATANWWGTATPTESDVVAPGFDVYEIPAANEVDFSLPAAAAFATY